MCVCVCVCGCATVTVLLSSQVDVKRSQADSSHWCGMYMLLLPLVLCFVRFFFCMMFACVCRANQLANVLHKLGLRRNKICGILMERCADYIVAYIAIHKVSLVVAEVVVMEVVVCDASVVSISYASNTRQPRVPKHMFTPMHPCTQSQSHTHTHTQAGGAYLPIEAVHPTSLVFDIVEDATPVAVITTSQYAHRLPPDCVRVLLDVNELESVNRLANEKKGQVEDTTEEKAYEENITDTHKKHSRATATATATATVARPTVPWYLDEECTRNAEWDQATLDDLAYAVYSSGTTGRPKGILCPHRGAVNSYHDRHTHYPYATGERYASNVFFVWEAVRPLLVGTPCYVIPDRTIYDPCRLVAYLQCHACTRLLLTPSLLGAVLDTPRLPCDGDLPALRIVWLCGEVVTRELTARFFRRYPHVRLLNLYSISECHDVSVADLALTPPSPRYSPAGHLMHNVHVFVLDHDLRHAPLGVPGEVFVGGHNLARGYLNLPDRNAERFISNPFRSLLDHRHLHLQPPSPTSHLSLSSPTSHLSLTSPSSLISPTTPPPTQPQQLRSSALLYRTGDVGRFLPGGLLEIMGRCDFMVKIRGYSVELGAVEATLVRHAFVLSCLAVAFGDEGEEKRLVAYVVLEEEVEEEVECECERTAEVAVGRGARHRSEEDAEDEEDEEEWRTQQRLDRVRTWLRDQLPHYMIPAQFIPLRALPLNDATGKADRSKLPSPPPVGMRPLRAPSTFTSPSTSTSASTATSVSTSASASTSSSRSTSASPSSSANAPTLSPRADMRTTSATTLEGGRSSSTRALTGARQQQSHSPAALASWRALLHRELSQGLGVRRLQATDSFLDMGAHSLLLARIAGRLRAAGLDVGVAELYEHHTLRSLEAFLFTDEESAFASTPPRERERDRAEAVERQLQEVGEEATEEQTQEQEEGSRAHDRLHRIAVVAVDAEFVGCANAERLWERCRDGEVCLRRMEAAELGDERARALASEHGTRFVAVDSALPNATEFDADFFGLSDSEAARLDPQHRLFLQACLRTLESAGHGDIAQPSHIGVFAACYLNTYAVHSPVIATGLSSFASSPAGFLQVCGCS
jgi:non-ribosomal peptide synthetase component F/aryl carrier-like protein